MSNIPCAFCQTTDGGQCDMHDMGQGRMMWLCQRCRQLIADGEAREVVSYVGMSNEHEPTSERPAQASPEPEPEPEPLSETRLAEIRAYLTSDMPWDEIAWVAHDALELLAEVDRLRTIEGELLTESDAQAFHINALQASLAARDEIVRAVAGLPLDDTCLIDDPDATEHAPDCWVSKARALLASTATAGQGRVRRSHE